jgi:predicted HTH domain antitoxin
MTLTIPDIIAQQTRFSERDFLLELAITLFSQEKLTLGSAAALAGLPQTEFQIIVGGRGIEMHYGVEELEHDIKTLEYLREIGL